MDRDALWRLAARQHGVFAVRQAGELGFGRRRLNTMKNRGDLVPVDEHVMRVAGAPDSLHARAMVAVLSAGPEAAVSHESAAALWRIPGYPAEPWQVTTFRQRHRPSRAVGTVHEPRRLRSSHFVLLEGIPVTTPARTLFDLANLPYVHPKRLERALDTAWSAHLVSARSLQAMLDDLQGPGRRGIRLMRELLAERGESYVPPESGLERRFIDLMEEAGIRGFERQVHVGGEEPIGRVDFVHPGLRLVVEIDSDTFHTSLLDRAADERRTAELEAAGFVVLRFTEFQLWHRPEEVVAAIKQLRWRMPA